MAMVPASSSACASIKCHDTTYSTSPSLFRLSEGKPKLLRRTRPLSFAACSKRQGGKGVYCSSGDSFVSTKAAQMKEEEEGEQGMSWVAVIPASALPKGERRLVRQDGQDVLLLWYKGEVIAIENSSPAEGAYSEGFVNAKLTQDGCIVCPSTDSTFDLKTGEIKEWFPTNPVLRLLTPPLRKLITYPVKADSEYIYISTQTSLSGDSAEIVFGGQVQAGKSAPNVEVDEVKMVVDESEEGFGFTLENEIINGRSAMVGFTVLLIFELITGKGFLKGIGFLDFLYRFLPDFPILKY
eukprot:c16123_g1_i1 orf=50-937(+)